MLYNKKILVTGGGGFLGKAIIKQLIKKKALVSSLSRQFYPELQALGIKQLKGDLADKNMVDNKLKGMDLVFHVAAKAGQWGTWEEFYDSNVKGTENIVAGCKNNNISKLIYTSSPSVVFSGADIEGGDESLPYPEKFYGHYPATKALAEKIVLKESSDTLHTIIIRPPLIWGPEDNHLVPQIIKRAKQLKKIGRIDDLSDTTYIDNAAYAHILAAEKLISDPSLSSNIYFISQDNPVSKWELADKFLHAAGLEPITKRASGKTAYLAGAFFEGVYKMFNIKKDPPMTRFAAKELAASRWFDISKAKKDLGYYPKVSIEEGVENLKLWFEKQTTRAKKNE